MLKTSTSQEIKDTTHTFLRTKGLNENVTCSIMGNIQMESAFDPNLVEVGTGVGFGLCQWSFGRRVALENYGIDLTHQLNFLWSELTGENLEITGASLEWINKTGYLILNEFLIGNGTISELTSSFCFCFERPDETLAHLDERITWSNYYVSYYGSVVPPVGKVKIKNYYLYGQSDLLFGKKFYPKNLTFEVVEEKGNITIIKDGDIVHKIPSKNIIK